ncbi:hypothetical protein Fleli_1761 [Bernardetia litoralis DSM 6794]|uniref:Endonuclease/exonuclease/phosphatase domain-containing protein n=1 Tax=Bernardetia litoralis (strain ATCC 23117 / DSM 6794 / NBRC 15988 / NCIMB 1366 / Fx l1 / Sio-4) TaxID=880071 RepID=I4AJM5_BERLS|nr:endonuclease/exonuclease/phosphatase family protein [Bernardetia litoralis]AFM04160.1 hypothetical protein Fleli_1761 [Bernardetia litoralis DSM 6794]
MFKRKILSSIPILFLLASFISLFSFWLGDLFSHFRMFWTVLSVIFVIAYFFLSKEKIYRKSFAFSFFALLINIYGSFSFWTNSQTYEYLFFGSPTDIEYSDKLKQEIENDTTVKSLLLMNLLSSNNEYLEVDALINKVDADFVVIIELNKKWENEFYYLKQNYKYQFTEVREDNFGMGFYAKEQYQDSSKIRLSQHILKIEDFKTNLDEILRTTKNTPVEIQITTKQKYTIFISHPIPPINLESYRNRNNKLEQISENLEKLNSKVLLVGDLNCSPFSADYQNFLKNSGLKDSQQNYGFQPTWNSSLPFLMQTPIDHVWHSEDIEILHRQTLPIKGSDHKAVLVVFR